MLKVITNTCIPNIRIFQQQNWTTFSQPFPVTNLAYTTKDRSTEQARQSEAVKKQQALVQTEKRDQ